MEKTMKTLFNSFLAVSIVVLLLSTNMLQAQSVIKTWDFESSLENWTSGDGAASIALSSEQAANGSQSVKLVGTINHLQINLKNDIYKDVQEGDIIQLKIWISAVELADVNGFAFFYQDGSGWAWHDQWINTSAVTGDQWTTLQYTYPAIGSPLQRIGFQVNDKDGMPEKTPTIYIDNITVSRAVVPVELVSFTANVVGNKVTLSWRTATEKNNAGFEVQKSKDGKEYVRAGYVDGKGTTTEKQSYSYIDNITSSGKCYYRLKQTDYDGTFSYSNVVEVSSIPLNYNLSQNYPNPFNPTSTIGFGIMEKGNVRMSILNILGEEIRVLLNEEKEAGYHSIDFNASDLPSGIYFYRIQAGNFIDTKKMLLLK